MKKTAYKKTSDNWLPCFALGDDELVQVNLIQLSREDWRVCAWGGDAFGMDKDYDSKKEAIAVFLKILQWNDVTISKLFKLGFTRANYSYAILKGGEIGCTF